MNTVNDDALDRHASPRNVIESNGANPVPDSERGGKARGLFPLWFSWNASLFGVSYGIYVYMFGLSWWQAILAGSLGYLISTFFVGVVAVGGPRTGLPTLTQTRFSFGLRGNLVGVIFSYISSVGWQVVTITVAAGSGANLLARLLPSIFSDRDGGPTFWAVLLCFAIVLGAVLTISVVGFHLIAKVENIIAWVSGGITIVFFFLVLPKMDFAAIAAAPNGSPSNFVGGMILAMTMIGLGYLASGGDFSRYLPRNVRARSVISWTAAGISAPVIGLLIMGVLLAASDPDLAAAASADPITALANLVPEWFLIPFTLVVMLTMIAAAIMGVYSSGLALVSTGVPISRAVSTATTTVLIAAGSFYLLFISASFFATFQAFLAIVSVVIGSMATIQMLDFVRQRRLGWNTDMARGAGFGGRSVRWTALVSLVIATVIGLGLITSYDPAIAPIVGFLLTDDAKSGFIGATNIGVLLAMVIAGILYSLLTYALKITLPPDYSRANGAVLAQKTTVSSANVES